MIKNTKNINFQILHSKCFAIFVALFLFVSIHFSISQEYRGQIYSTVPHIGQAINFGPVFLNDTLEIKFVARNTGELPIKIEQGIPTFFLGLSPNDPTTVQWERFRRVSAPRTYQPGESDTLRINFLSGDTLVTRTGWHEALLGVSFLPADKESDETISKIDTFFLRVKKTPYFVAGYEDDIRFDSVYIHPNVSQGAVWRVKNVWKVNQPAFALDKRLITQPFSRDEILVSDLPVSPLNIYPDSTINIPVSYYPLNRGRDSMFLRLLYHPLKDNFPDSVDFAWTRITGTGVEQDLRIVSSNYNWSNDTIDLGDVFAGRKININIGVKNYGNIPFGALSQVLLENVSENTFSDAIIKQEFSANIWHLKPDSVMHSEIEFLPKDNGFFIVRFRVESDIFSRNISGAQPTARFKYFYLKGNIVGPKIVTNITEIDMGNVIVSTPECDARRDTVLNIFNVGNYDLIIYNVLTEPAYPESRFFPNRQNLIIPAGKSDTLSIQFLVLQGDYDTYSSKLIFVTNQAAPFDSVVINLKGTSIPPIAANLIIQDDLKSKPGTNIEVPVIVKSNGTNPAKFARNFRTSLFYNRSILEFNGISTIGFACEGSLNYGDMIENPDSEELILNIRKPDMSFFTSKDTLFVIKFKTYLGNSAVTDITFIEPKFSDGKCENILTILPKSGRYFTDSVCGIDYKALPSANGNFKLTTSINNVTNSNIFSFELPYTTNAEVNICNVAGEKLIGIINQTFPAGIYTFTHDFDELSSGFYFIELVTPAIRIVKPLPVVK